MSGCARRPRRFARAWLAAYPVERRVAERRLELVHLALLVLDLHARRHRRAPPAPRSPTDAARVGREPRRAHTASPVARSAARKALVALRFPSRRAGTKFLHSSPDFLDSKIMVLPNRPPRPPRRMSDTPTRPLPPSDRCPFVRLRLPGPGARPRSAASGVSMNSTASSRRRRTCVPRSPTLARKDPAPYSPA